MLAVSNLSMNPQNRSQTSFKASAAWFPKFSPKGLLGNSEREVIERSPSWLRKYLVQIDNAIRKNQITCIPNSRRLGQEEQAYKNVKTLVCGEDRIALCQNPLKDTHLSSIIKIKHGKKGRDGTTIIRKDDNPMNDGKFDETAEKLENIKPKETVISKLLKLFRG